MVHLTEAVDETLEVEKADDESEAGESVNIDASSSRQLRDRSTMQEPDRLTYDTFAAMIGGPAELKYLAGMAEIDPTELSTAYVADDPIDMQHTYVGINVRRITYQFLGELFRVRRVWRITWKAVKLTRPPPFEIISKKGPGVQSNVAYRP